jgi:acyl phosphate:glycerol-3-phosphate acyltransferase
VTQPQLITFILGPIIGYLLGSIPFAFILGKLKGVDIRKVGSGNVGATNLGRTVGMKFFWLAFLLDGLKGFLPVFSLSLLVHHWNYDGWTAYPGSALSLPLDAPLPTWSPLLSGIAAMLGHLYPVWLKFRGGKGVSTAFGLVLGLWPLFTVAGLLSGLAFVLVFFAYRYISVSSISSSALFPIFVFLFGTAAKLPLVGDFLYTPPGQLYPLVAIGAAFALLIAFKHRGNISRLIQGTEPKFGQKKP